MITASIVTYHTRADELEKVISCLLDSPVQKLYVVDNASDDATRDLVQKYTFVEYTAAENRGYGAGHNIALRRAMTEGSKYHIVMNSDIYWSGDVIGRCAKYMDDNADVGQLMPNVYYPDGSQQYQCKLIPSPVDLLLKRFLPAGLKRKRMRRFQLEFTGYDHIMNVPYLSGCFMMLRTDALREVGLFDERFFMYPEDIDLTRRVHERYRTVFFPEVSITHVYAVTSRKNLRMFMIHTLNMIKYFNKWGWVIDRKRREYNARLLESEHWQG